MSELLAGIGQWAVEIVYSFGYWGVFVMVALMNLHVLPLPTQLPLCLGGFLVGQGQFSFLGMLGASTAKIVCARSSCALSGTGSYSPPIWTRRWTSSSGTAVRPS
jgi:hypothetical protein